MIQIETTDTNVAQDAAGHDFEVEKQRLHTERNNLIPDHVAIVKKDTNQYLGTVGIGWEPVQPKAIYELAQELMDATNGHINGVFSMFGDAVIGISLKLAEREYVQGEKIALNFLMLTSFNGSYGIAGHATCSNAERRTFVNMSNKVYNLKHTKFVGNRLEVVKNMLKFYNSEIQLFDEKMGRLVTKAMSKQEAVNWFRSLFPKPKSPRAERALENQVIAFIEAYDETCNVPGVRGTRYGAFQALTQYVNHHRTVKVHNNRDEDEVRFQSIHFGTANTLAQKGLNSLTKDFDEDVDEFKAEDFLID